ncbi:MAG: Gfo/Idh/MocA family oxidoreductase [Kiritimatiellae bacterium]|nr:Gfo/Idh/MocA family oxidoreductase [Kiritimatiellia bacterium]
MNRRTFLKQAAWACGGTAALAASGCGTLSGQAGVRSSSMLGFSAEPLKKIRIGVIGVGARGTGAVKRLPKIPNVTITALSDLREERVTLNQKILKDNGLPEAKGYSGSPEAWRALCESSDVDLVYICTPWWWHTPMSVMAMKCGKHAATEIPAGVTVDECWELVETSEKTRRHCMMLENCCYGENELLMLNLCRQGVLGDLVHGEGAYIHEMRASKWREEQEGGRQGRWRLEWSRKHTGNPYPCHGLGPVCQYMNINRGDSLEYLNSVSTDPFGLAPFGAAKYGPDSPEARIKIKQGDMNTSIIRTRRGRTIMLQHDTTSPRPYSRLNLISGTKGIAADYPLRVALEPDYHKWMDDNKLAELVGQYRHPLWRESGDKAKKAGGHGGMDFLMELRLCHCLQHGLPLDMDVYDAALWSSIVELSERSVLRRGAPMDIPDFTRGGWKTAEPLGIVTL